MRRPRSGFARSIRVPFAGSAGLLPPVAIVVLAVLSVWAVAYELGDTVVPAMGNAPPFRGVAHDIAFALAGVLLIARSSDGERGWALIGAGALCWAAGDVYWTLRLANLSSPPVPSWADAGYLSFCPLAFAGILSLVRQRASGAPRTLVADALAASLAVGALSAAVVVEPVLAGTDGGTIAVATNLAYPVFDMLLLGLIVGATALGSWRLSRTWMLLAAAVLAFWIADSLYLITVATNTYQQDAWFNPLWFCSPILAAWAAWLPRSASVSAPPPGRTTSARGIVVPLAFTFLALSILVWSSFDFVGVPAIVLATSSLLVVMLRLVLTWRENMRLLQASRHDAMIDALTGLANRRALTGDLELRILSADLEHPVMLVMFDLDGFKHYNDNFGHPAGDALLQRLGRNLRSQLADEGIGYRMGGDEFCALIDQPQHRWDTTVKAAAAALSERGEGFTIGCSYGSILLPSEAQDSETALRIADQRMYAHKRGGRVTASRQSRDVLLRALAERNPELGAHGHDVAALAAGTAAAFSLPAEEIEQIRQAAELHDVGKVAIPDAILEKPAKLDESEWAFMRRHTLIGERIIAAAPDLRHVATLVRSSHENFDGSGYPDALAGEEIPLGARIITVCDAFDAMTTDRPYREAMDEQAAMAELRRCAGSQFDPDVVERFCDLLATAERSGERRAA
jgi:two-component system, cell cycle response regulator